MSKENPLSERILDATVAMLRRHGVDKTNVVDVARALGMSHGNIYRHFSSKQALINAVAARWLRAVLDPLEAIASSRSRAPSKRLAAWFDTLREIKQRKVIDDPELFRLHHQIVSQIPEVVAEHVAALLRQVQSIIEDGIKTGEFSSRLDPPVAARAFLQATTPFHHPALLLQNPPHSEADARAVFNLLLAGMKAQ
jgi:AcrR family transcriptional regulator